MKRKGRKDRIRYKNKLRKQYLTQMDLEAEITEEDDRAANESAAARVRQKVKEMSGVEQDIIIDDSLEKMSEILQEYAGPLLNVINSDDKSECEKAFMIAIVFWNYSIAAETPGIFRRIWKMWKMRRVMRPFMADAESRSVMRYMVDRKRQMFPDNRRVIVSFDLAEERHGFHLFVASSVD
ncbi:MAG: hypothetical protein LBL26_11415 [Peptococcaceae bacterium]|jgi:hypothetical protein|nr:hypothetical protein [Peptococcaceae bacterium]